VPRGWRLKAGGSSPRLEAWRLKAGGWNFEVGDAAVEAEESE
jgi:hypothetical protein